MTVRYGAMRESVLGLTLIDGRGEVVRTHSQARKPSAGYHLTRLVIGSEETLGPICEAILRIHPVPPAMAAAACTFPTVTAAVQCVVRVGQHGIPVARIELADELQIETINRHDQTSLAVALTLVSRVSPLLRGRRRRAGAGDRRDRRRARVAAAQADIAEHGIGYGKSRFLVDEHGAAAVEMMRSIKRALDPDGIFNPGKVAA